MPALRTEVTEITTGLAMLGFPDLDRALEVRPRAVRNVGAEHYQRLTEAHDSGRHRREFEVAWRNGVEFARSPEGLRGRPPWWLEWKGGHRPPGYEQVPADLRVDHVYLVSCKYGSNILTNSSPANLFDRLLADRRDTGSDWFLDVAPDPYQELYLACRTYLDAAELPDHVSELRQEDREVLKRGLPRRFGGDLQQVYREFAAHVARSSVERWRAAMTDRRRQEMQLWRLLRLQAAPYFVLGESADGRPLQYRVGTPWDFRNRYRFRSMAAWADPDRSQPVVHWRAEVADQVTGAPAEVTGHVEVRWSHGRFAQAPEAKVYLGTPHHAVPGYVPLNQPDRDPDRLALGWGDGHP